MSSTSPPRRTSSDRGLSNRRPTLDGMGIDRRTFRRGFENGKGTKRSVCESDPSPSSESFSFRADEPWLKGRGDRRAL